MSRSKTLKGMNWLFTIMGIGSIYNAVWMLLAPEHWYLKLPAGVPDYGPFNEHFVRDIGCAFGVMGIALVWAVLSSRYRLPLVAIATVFFASHAVLHIYDTLRGAVDGEHWRLDLAGVYVPAVLLAISTAILARRESGN